MASLIVEDCRKKRIQNVILISGKQKAANNSQTGAITLIQRFGSSLNLNIHFHILFLDEVYIKNNDNIFLIFIYIKQRKTTWL